MKLFQIALAGCIAVGLAVGAAADDPPQKGAKGDAATKMVIVPLEGKDPCEVTVKDTVRITATGIAGSRMTVGIDGPAKLDSTTTVIQRAGKQNVVGGMTEEYEIRPTKAGRVTVKVTVKPPQPDAEPKVTEYKLLVK